MPAFDANRLYSALQTSGLQSSNPPLHQVIYQLIRGLVAAQDGINSSGSGSASTTINEINNIFQITSGDSNGGDGESLVVPGLQGIQGVPGSAGATGPQGGVIGIIYESPEESYQYPPIIGPQGNSGNTGSTGAQGPIGISLFPNDGEDGEPGYMALPSEGGSSGPSGALVFLVSQVASASATLDFTSLISSVYNKYIFDFENIVPATDNAELLMRCSVDNGATYAAGASDYAFADYINNTGAFSTNAVASAAATAIKIMPSLDFGVPTGGVNGSLQLFNPLNLDQVKTVIYQVGAFLNDAQYYNCVGGGWYKLLSAPGLGVDAIRFLMDTGNIASGTIRMYGVKNS